MNKEPPVYFAFLFIYFYFLLETKEVLIIDKNNMRRMRSPPQTYKNLIKKWLNTFTIQGGLYKKVKST